MSSLDEKARTAGFWRSLAELEGRPEFQAYVEHEFAEPLADEPPGTPGRRRFMQLMGASLALAGATGCRWEEDYVLPYSRRPADLVPGEARYYASAQELGGVSTGLLVQSVDGRPIKVEGNPLHPSSLGAATYFAQASVLGLYDPDRSQDVLHRRGRELTRTSWEHAERVLAERLAVHAADGGAGLRVLAEATSSPTVKRLRRALTEKLPGMVFVEYEPISFANERDGTRRAFGRPLRPVLHLDRAAVVLSLGGDVISPAYPGGLANTRALATGRVPDAMTMNRVYAVEPALSTIGGVADHRLALRATQIRAFAAALDAKLGGMLPRGAAHASQTRPNAAFLDEPYVARFLDAVAKDLAKAKNAAVVVVGPEQPPEVHAIACRLNYLLGAIDNTISYIDLDEDDVREGVVALEHLVADLRKGVVETLIILGGNPVYDAPADIELEDALSKAKVSIRLGLYDDETSQRCAWHLPQAHFLEAWADSRAHDGTITISQPLMAPLYGGRSPVQVLALMLGDKRDIQFLLRETHDVVSDREWRKAVHDGLMAGTARPRVGVELLALPPIQFQPPEVSGGLAEGESLELVFGTDSKVYDGRFANNAWLQELPDAMTKLTWGNAALIDPGTATRLGVKDGHWVVLSYGGRELKVAALHAPGQAPGSVKLVLGYGRTWAGLVGGHEREGIEPIGANAFLLRTKANLFFGTGLRVHPTSEVAPVATTQDLHAIDPRGREGADSRLGAIVRGGTLEQYKARPDFAKHVVHHPPLLSMWEPPVAYTGHKWGMAIDMNRCTGCNACVIACQAENNVPVVGRERVAQGREMHWLRIDRYFKGTPDNPEVVFQPMTCQHCENAPCEQVCPVGATMHSSEGLNEMTYNRCIGTRYCSNNCPYKVRRFNFHNYHVELKESRNKVKHMLFNPEVTVRSRGVMEKCTFCVQRIQKVKIQAKNARRPIEDGEIKTACQQTCPADAIVFGDLNDTGSTVAQRSAVSRSYRVLEELNNHPRIAYLARIRNLNPELV